MYHYCNFAVLNKVDYILYLLKVVPVLEGISSHFCIFSYPKNWGCENTSMPNRPNGTTITFSQAWRASIPSSTMPMADSARLFYFCYFAFLPDVIPGGPTRWGYAGPYFRQAYMMSYPKAGQRGHTWSQGCELIRPATIYSNLAGSHNFRPLKMIYTLQFCTAKVQKCEKS